MKDIAARYIRPDGGICEGTAYLGQTGTAALWAVLAYCRSRGLNWEKEFCSLFKNVDDFVRIMCSTTLPGKVIPFADCRVSMFGGDIIPVLARLFPQSASAAILANCLEQGSVFTLSGTLSKSGGLIGMVYGPAVPAQSSDVVMPFQLLQKSAKISSYREKAGLKTRFWMTGKGHNETHTHKDQGSFILEANGHEIFIERGVVEYWKPEASLLFKTEMHNTLTFFTAQETNTVYLDQDVTHLLCAVTGKAKNTKYFTAAVEMTAAYASFTAKKVVREVISNAAEQFVIKDYLETETPYNCAFHLQSLEPFIINGLTATVVTGNIVTTVSLPWATHLLTEQILCNYAGMPVYRLTAQSNAAKKHSLETTIVLSVHN